MSIPLTGSAADYQSFYDATITLIPKPNEDIIRKTKLQTNIYIVDIFIYYFIVDIFKFTYNIYEIIHHELHV